MGHPPSVVEQELETFTAPMAATREMLGLTSLVPVAVAGKVEAQGILAAVAVALAVMPVLSVLAEPEEKREEEEIPVLMATIPFLVVMLEQEVQADHREELEVRVLVVLVVAAAVVVAALWCTGKGVKNEKSTYFP
jgi:hypothetical protein